MEREVDFYCKEILRWTSGKPQCEVLTSQALFSLGLLLVEKNSTEFPIVFWGLNGRLESSMKHLEDHPVVMPKPSQTAESSVNTAKFRDMISRRRRDQGKLTIVLKMIEKPSSGARVGPLYGSAVERSLEHVFGAGLAACLNCAIRKFVEAKGLKVAMEIFQLVLPRAQDKPLKCLQVTSAPPDEFGDIDDDIYLSIKMPEASKEGQKSTPDPVWTTKNVDIPEESNAVQNTTPDSTWTVLDCETKAVNLIMANNVRTVLQSLVLNYPLSDAPAFTELYAIDLFGRILSTCEVQFLWSNVTSATVKSRNLASRVLSSALKYNSKKDWFNHVFLKSNGGDHELATAWLLGTLDVSALNSASTVAKFEDAPFSVGKTRIDDAASNNHQSARDSDYWVMLTDGIIYHLLRKDSLGIGAMDSQILTLLQEVASTCKFPTVVRANGEGLQDVATLYDLHLDVFQSFCRSAGATWALYTKSPTQWNAMNQFRVKMARIFVSFLDRAYKINFRRACDEIDKMNHNWHKFAKLFLRQAGVNTTGGRSYHEMDDTIKSFDDRLQGLTTMFRFMYQCMDALLFYCGGMAIGDTNLFFDAMELLFRQVNSAEYPQAVKRLEGQPQRKSARNVNEELQTGFCPAAIGFVDSVRLFFARQKYPSLLHWFAQTSDIYQTFSTRGWFISPLRTLFVNILDPDGPLGIHSYYPADDHDTSLDMDVRAVRREAFYISCGLFNCKCTRSFEHSRNQSTSTSCARIQQLRKFILDNFVRETLSYVLQEDVTTLLETMVPLCQFMRAVLNHANLNVSISRGPQVVECNADSSNGCLDHYDFQLKEVHPCLEWMVECLIKLAPGENAVNSTISCVLLIELCGIVCEAIAFNEYQPMLELIDLVDLAVCYLQTIYLALSKTSTCTMDTLFSFRVDSSPLIKLNMYQFSQSAFRDIMVSHQHAQVLSGQTDSYGISLARATTDLLAAIGRVAQQCSTSSDQRIRGFTTLSSR
ncbi:unnamed protein product [Phytophthora lilii]|uniref:Unnamed protein product n=1 Tax=Phytophthora lilii TaxID=2077276 RepID=A0A9W6TQ90_9STRA|nr:unnamed protein product [Phytophthora lilii]